MVSFSSSGDDGEKKSLSMDDVKKFGVAGTVAYVLTELAFWVVAFPVAGAALYQTTGHWPDVINEAGDRAAVLGFIQCARGRDCEERAAHRGTEP